MVEAAPQFERPRKRWSVDDYLRLVELGVIRRVRVYGPSDAVRGVAVADLLPPLEE